ncbi:MAG: exosortase A [bacterium]
MKQVLLSFPAKETDQDQSKSQTITPRFLISKKMLLHLSIFSLGVGILYYSVFKSLVYDWLHLPDFSHGFLVPILSLFFVWERREDLAQLPVLPRDSGLIVIFLGIILLLAGNLGGESFTMRVSFLVFLFGSVLFLLGWPFIRKLLFPLGFLLFMIPIPSLLMGKITFPMQIFASRVAAFSIEHLGIPVLREGNIIILAHATLEVAEACSGLRSLISLLALGTVFAYFTQKGFWQRLILVLSCFPIAVFINALRVTVTGVLAHYWGSAAAEGLFHEFIGFGTFFMAFVLLFGLNCLLSRIIKVQH